MEKSLQEKAIDIKGKKYVLVADRIIYFNETYPEGCIETNLLSSVDSESILVKATVTPDGKRVFTGHSQATKGDGYINKTSALENAETSAVGRALAMMGIGVIDSVASVDELTKAMNAQTPVMAPQKRLEPSTLSPADEAEMERAFGGATDAADSFDHEEQKPDVRHFAKAVFVQKVVGSKCADCGVGTIIANKNPVKQPYCNKFCWNKNAP